MTGLEISSGFLIQLSLIVQALCGWTETKLQQKVSLQNYLLQGPKSPRKYKVRIAQ